MHLFCVDEAQRVQPARPPEGDSSWSEGYSRSQRRCSVTFLGHNHSLEATTQSKDIETIWEIWTVVERNTKRHFRMLLEHEGVA